MLPVSARAIIGENPGLAVQQPRQRLWSGGISNPLSVIEQLTYLLFIKGLDELHTLRTPAAGAARPEDHRFAYGTRSNAGA